MPRRPPRRPSRGRRRRCARVLVGRDRLAPRCGRTDRGRPRQGQRQGSVIACRECPRQRRDPPRWHRDTARRAHQAFPVPQAAGRGDDQPRSGRPENRVRRAAGGPAPADDHRAARHQHGRPAASHKRRRAFTRARTACDRLAATLPRARARRDRPGPARGSGARHHDRRRRLWPDPRLARPDAGVERVADAVVAGGQEPGGPPRAGTSPLSGDAADPDRLRPVSARPSRPRRDRGGSGQGVARAARRLVRTGRGGTCGPAAW